MDPFETDKVDPGTTGLVDNWRSKLARTPAVLNLRTPVTPERQQSPSLSTLAVTPTPLSVRSTHSLPSLWTDLVALTQIEDTLPVYMLPRFVNRQKVYPGIKDLPTRIHTNFRNTFIRLIIRDVFTSTQPWVNPDLSMLQLAYDKIYPAYPAHLQSNDAVFHPVSHRHRRQHVIQLSDPLNQTVTSIGVVRNRIGTAATFAVTGGEGPNTQWAHGEHIVSIGNK
jgi:hypothetical protein